MNMSMSEAEKIAKHFHQTYEELAPSFSYETREASRTEWENVPENNKKLMVAVVENLLSNQVIIPGFTEDQEVPQQR